MLNNFLQKGQFDSWLIINDNLAMKKTDRSVFKHHGSGIPMEIRWFFDAEEFALNERMDIILSYSSQQYNAYIKRESSLGRTRLFWFSDLSEIFNNYYSSCDTYPRLFFWKKGYGKYEIYFASDDGEEIIAPLDDTCTEEEQQDQAQKMDVESLKASAIARTRKHPVEKEVLVKQTPRDPYIAEYAKVRANGRCQLCGNVAPFNDSKGKPYLESHHIIWLARGGEDSIDNTVGLCPNCHRKMHVVNSPEDVEMLLRIAMK